MAQALKAAKTAASPDCPNEGAASPSHFAPSDSMLAGEFSSATAIGLEGPGRA